MSRRHGLALTAVLTVAVSTGPATAATAGPQPAAAAGPRPLIPSPGPLVPYVPLAVRQAAAPAILDVGHRGASAYAPENTLASFRLARSRHADMFELDVQQTKDHKLVIMHDTTLARTTNVEHVYPQLKPWKVSQLTLKQIKRLDAGSWHAKKYKGERVPTLDEVLTAMGGTGAGMLLELKNPALYPGIEGRVAAALERHRPYWLGAKGAPARSRLIVQSFDWGSVKRFHKDLPGVPTGLLGMPKAKDLKKVKAYADLVHPAYGDLTKTYVKQVHAAHLGLLTWTVNNKTKMAKAVDLGVDGIITNKPDVLYTVLKASA
ncbi:glycerophosphodiester phosphodiesterase [Actinomadura sp. LD22]|uniref:Glycerophosphodiester phosphodiesterase n=1 Tax=Actinomadura physcomitrii TaxID=2650748 RepID=A0A6I4MQF8_9ACTN|nr:glycerophosphodiester phosphodiesterase family protein [Actinomadura physcomitrii]MWA05601.1 glycerophosphodiester phosphodiesterase [Actinomadura physcomitrii]